MINQNLIPIDMGTAALGCPVERGSTALFPAGQRPGYAPPAPRGRLSLLVFAVFLSLAASAFAQTLTGTVTNKTTSKPASGDEVVLLKLGQGMEEAGRTRTDSRGNFSFKLDDTQSPHLVRAIHQDVTYHRMAPPGTTSVELDVYDVAKKIDGIEVVADIMRVQVEQGQLEVIRQFAVQNTSKPPRTQMNEHNLEFYVPAEAKVIEGSAMTEHGNPVNSAPVPESSDKTRYSFIFPLRPGTTQFQVLYQLPYTGSANIDPKSIYPLQHFVAILPKSMQFSAAPGTNYQSMSDPQQPDATVQVASNAQSGQTLAFKISGEGVLQARQENAGPPGEGGGQQGGEARPGGGLGPPIDAPDPLQKYRWWILGGFALALVVGGVFVAWRQQSGRVSPRATSPAMEEEDEIPASPRRAKPQPAPPQVPPSALAATMSRTSMLLEGLKEEIFQLEVERKQGHISQPDYEKAKAALDQTLERALKREAAKS